MNLFEYEFFKELTQDEKEKIKSDSKFISMPIDSPLYYEGDINQDVLFLKSGIVKVFISPDNITKRLNTVLKLIKSIKFDQLYQ